ncbi:hypothetical protein IMSAGC021_00619 [Muribaculaceae bacterium]|nr:hypothetical protein IMSAGC021_00619 [Muribaculaceae bacterium]
MLKNILKTILNPWRYPKNSTSYNRDICIIRHL